MFYLLKFAPAEVRPAYCVVYNNTRNSWQNTPEKALSNTTLYKITKTDGLTQHIIDNPTANRYVVFQAESLEQAKTLYPEYFI